MYMSRYRILPTNAHLWSTLHGGTLWYAEPRKNITSPAFGCITSSSNIKGEEPSGIFT